MNVNVLFLLVCAAIWMQVQEVAKENPLTRWDPCFRYRLREARCFQVDYQRPQLFTEEAQQIIEVMSKINNYNPFNFSVIKSFNV